MKGSNQASEIALRQAGTFVGTSWDRASLEHFWEAASCEIPPANEVAWKISPSRHLLPTMALHSTTRQVIQESMARGRDIIIIIVMSSCWGSGSGKWSFNPSQSFNLARFWKSLGFDVGCGLIDKNGSLCFFWLYTIRNPWHLEFFFLGSDVHVLHCFFPPPPPSTKRVNYVHRSISATCRKGRRYLDCQEEFRHPGSKRWVLDWHIFRDFIPIWVQVCRFDIFFQAFCTALVFDFSFMIQSMIWKYMKIYWCKVLMFG